MIGYFRLSTCAQLERTLGVNVVICAVLQYKVRSWEYGKRLKQPLVAAHPRRLTHEGLTQLTNLRYRHHSGLYTSENGDGSRCQRRGICSRRWMTSMRSARWTSRERPVLPRLQRRANIAPLSILGPSRGGSTSPEKQLDFAAEGLPAERATLGEIGHHRGSRPAEPSGMGAGLPTVGGIDDDRPR
jgi:hypothetical protein